MKQIYVDSIARAKNYYDGYDDVIHNLSHSRRVAELAIVIAGSLGYKDVDFLELCAYWHDTARAQGIEPHEEAGAILARDDLLKRGISQEEANRVYEGIRFHKSTASPSTIEGKIIRDADKLDIFTLERWKACANAGWRQEYSDDIKKTVRDMAKYPDAFTYDVSKKLFQECVPKFLDFYESVKDQLPE